MTAQSGIRASWLFHSYISRLIFTFILVVILMIIGIIVSSYSLNELLHQSDQLARLQQTQSKVQETKVALLDRTVRVSQYILLNQYQALFDYTSRQNDQLTQSITDYEQWLKAQPDLTLASAEESFVSQLKQAALSYNRQIEQMATQLQRGNPREASAILQDEFAGEVSRFNNLLTQRIQALNPLITRQKNTSTQTTATSQLYLLAGGFGVTLLTLALAGSLGVAMARRITALKRAVIALGQGNFEVKIRMGKSRDELSQVGQAFNLMTTELSTLLNDIEHKRFLGREAGQEVNVIVTQLSGSVGNQSYIAQEQSQALGEVTENLEQLGASAQKISQRTRQVTGRANTTLQAAMEMSEEIKLVAQASQSRSEQSIKTTNQLKTQLVDAEVIVQQLVDYSNSIGRVVELIESIAAQTHLLALNGAIEAAGAGVYGERFGVVVAEVSNLSSKTRQATTSVSEVVSQIYLSTTTLAETLTGITNTSEQSVKHSKEAGAALTQLSNFSQQRFEQIVESINTIVEQANQIENVTHLQSDAALRVLQTMRTLSDTSQTIATSSQQLAETTYQLRNLSNNMLEKLAV